MKKKRSGVDSYDQERATIGHLLQKDLIQANAVVDSTVAGTVDEAATEVVAETVDEAATEVVAETADEAATEVVAVDSDNVVKAAVAALVDTEDYTE